MTLQTTKIYMVSPTGKDDTTNIQSILNKISKQRKSLFNRILSKICKRHYKIIFAPGQYFINESLRIE